MRVLLKVDLVFVRVSCAPLDSGLGGRFVADAGQSHADRELGHSVEVAVPELELQRS